MDAVPIHGRDHCPGGPDEIPCLAAAAWAKRYAFTGAGPQSIASGSEINVALPDFATSDAAIFAAYDVGTADGITVLRNGLFSLVMRVYWVQWPGAHVLTFNGIDPDAFSGWSFHASALNPTNNLTAGMTVRLAANQHVYPTLYHEFGSARNLSQGGGTQMEMCYLGDTDVTNREGGP